MSTVFCVFVFSSTQKTCKYNAYAILCRKRNAALSAAETAERGHMKPYKKTNTFDVRTIIFIGLLGALSFVLMLIRFPLPFTPSFLDFDIAELPALFAGFFLGPAEGLLVVLVKLALKLAIQGTTTAFVGEAMNLVSSTVFVLSASVIYKQLHQKAPSLGWSSLLCW